jgi:hypothetical protein
MSNEAGSIVSAAVSVCAAAGVFIGIRRKIPAAVFFCGSTGCFALLACFCMGGEVRTQQARDAKQRETRYRLLAEYPLVTLEGRLPSRVGSPAEIVFLSSESKTDLDLTEKATDWRARQRQDLLKGLHDGTVEVFSEEIGQGAYRMPYVTKKVLGELARKDENPHQAEIVGSPDAPLPPAPEGTIEASLKSVHRLGVQEFANAQDFGFVTADGRQAVGFVPHRFTKPVRVDPRRRLKRFDLVGLVIHPEPVVYVSDKLPRMDELKSVPKRSLDGFEDAAVEALREGEAVVIRDDHAGTRMVGAIRAAKQCLTCHGAKRGELLGAFTYRFERL